MSTPARRKLGMVLIAISVLAVIAIQFTPIVLAHRRILHEDHGGAANVHWTSQEIEFVINWRYLIPILLCGGLGTLFFFWPARKPPKLDS
ncbi:MAG TPA: hypothetical protein VFC07_06865 [Verrucomicrobiae bacterium]|nr:hypothetical protein [Verrucomicrobiae bacterium]